MKALLYKGKNQLEINWVPIPEPEHDEVLIKVEYAGICGTDIHIFHGKHPRAKGPLVMGHEFSGVIVQCPENSELKVGDFVTAEPLISCGTCFTCLSGYPHVCKTLGLYGIDANGAFAQYVKMPVRKVYKIPEKIKPEVGALIEPIAVAIHALRLSNLKISDTVCILGGGPIGLLLALASREAGCKDVIICEMNSYRLKLAEDYGITTVDASREDVPARILNLTGNIGADIVFEAAGVEATNLLAPKLCRERGEVINVGIPKQPILSDILSITFKEITTKGVRVYEPFDFARAIDFIKRSDIDFTPFISGPYPLAEYEKAFAMAERGEGIMRAIFKINQEGK